MSEDISGCLTGERDVWDVMKLRPRMLETSHPAQKTSPWQRSIQPQMSRGPPLIKSALELSAGLDAAGALTLHARNPACFSLLYSALCGCSHQAWREGISLCLGLVISELEVDLPVAPRSKIILCEVVLIEKL